MPTLCRIDDALWKVLDTFFRLSHYEVLGVSRNAGPQEIEDAYLSNARIGWRKVSARHRLEAYRLLMDPCQRAMYDRLLTEHDHARQRPPC